MTQVRVEVSRSSADVFDTNSCTGVSSGPNEPVETVIMIGVDGEWAQSQPSLVPDSAVRSSSSVFEQHDEVGSDVGSAQHA